MADDLKHALQEFSKVFNEINQEQEKQSEEFWNSLTKEQQLQVFCAVVRRIYKGEIEDNLSYRGVLYQTFEFGPEAYVPAQMAGYMTIHNAIFDSEEVKYEREHAEEKTKD